MSQTELTDHINMGASGDVDNYELVVLRHNIVEINGEILKKSFEGYIYNVKI